MNVYSKVISTNSRKISQKNYQQNYLPKTIMDYSTVFTNNVEAKIKDIVKLSKINDEFKYRNPRPFFLFIGIVIGMIMARLACIEKLTNLIENVKTSPQKYINEYIDEVQEHKQTSD